MIYQVRPLLRDGRLRTRSGTPDPIYRSRARGDMDHQHPSTLSAKALLKALASGAKPPSLRQVNLDSCGLTAFPGAILEQHDLTALSLFDNRLMDIPSEITQ